MTYQIYCGTYAKYNAGSLDGKWFDLEDFADKNEFMEACQEYHGPGDHEFMFQDFEGIPRALIGECGIKPEVWDMMLHHGPEEAKTSYVDYYGEWDGDRFDESYRGEFKSDEDMAVEYLNDCGGLEGMPESLQTYFDYEKYAQDLLIDSMFESNGHYFWRQ